MRDQRQTDDRTGGAAASETSPSDALPGKRTLVQLAGAGSPMPAPLQKKMESSFGTDFSSVRVHEGGQAGKLGAHAYAQGDDLHFAPGQYQPDTQSGQALIGHELAHVVQQRSGRVAAPMQAKGAPVVADKGLEDEADRAGGAAARGEAAGISSSGGGASGAVMPKLEGQPIQLFGSQEHQSLGDTATHNASYNVGGQADDNFQLTHGDIVALSGDYFLAGPATTTAGGKGPQDDLFQLAGRAGNRGQAAGTRDEVIWALKIIRGNDARFAPGGAWASFLFSDAVKNAVNERYQRLAAANTTHFAAPKGRDGAGQPNPATESAGNSYRSTHETALRMACAAAVRHEPIDRAMAMEAAGQHYLTDAFSAGHLRTPVGSLREYWGGRYPLFWYNLRHKMALDTAIQMNAQSNNLTTALGTVNQMYAAISQKVEAMASSLPAVTLGDLLAKVFHDHDNVNGMEIQGGGRVYGDDNLDNPDPRNQTRGLAQRAIVDGNSDVQAAFRLGGSAGGQPIPDEQLFAQVRAATSTGTRYLAETRMPAPAQTEAPQNWQAASLEELWNKPVTGTGGPTVGAKIVEALQPGREIRATLDELADRFPETEERGTGNLQPRRAYRDGFLNPLLADPQAGLLGIVHWAPNYGLASNSRDDQSLASGKELDRAGQLGGMTTPARVKYINELLDGYTAEDEGALIVRIFESASSSERKGMYRQIEGHDWTGDFVHGFTVSDDKLWNGLTRGQLNQLRGIING